MYRRVIPNPLTRAGIFFNVSKNTGLSESQIKEIFNACVLEMKNALNEGRDVSIRGFGRFSHRITKPKMSIYIGGEMTTPRKKITFNQADAFFK